MSGACGTYGGGVHRVLVAKPEGKRPLGRPRRRWEDNINIDMPPNYTERKKGEKEVLLKTTGCEKLRLTVMLAATADGRKLPPFLILKRKTLPKLESFPKDVIVRAQEKGWMTEELMMEWLKLVWSRRPGAFLNQPSMLVLDAFKGHVTYSPQDEN
jgi:hypothetical protein